MPDNVPMLEVCPNSCGSIAVGTGIRVAEGELKACPGGGQMFSQCTRSQFDAAIGRSGADDLARPSDKEMKRLERRRAGDYRVIKRLLTGRPKIRLLDIGCSTGTAVEIFRGLGIDAEGIDPSPPAVEVGRARGLTLYEGYLEDLQFSDDSFDVLTMYEVIEHLPDPVSMLKECHRILKPNGVLLVGTGNTDRRRPGGASVLGEVTASGDTAIALDVVAEPSAMNA